MLVAHNSYSLFKFHRQYLQYTRLIVIIQRTQIVLPYQHTIHDVSSAICNIKDVISEYNYLSHYNILNINYVLSCIPADFYLLSLVHYIIETVPKPAKSQPIYFD